MYNLYIQNKKTIASDPTMIYNKDVTLIKQ